MYLPCCSYGCIPIPEDRIPIRKKMGEFFKKVGMVPEEYCNLNMTELISIPKQEFISINPSSGQIL